MGGTAGDIENVLAVTTEQGDQQRRSPMIQVSRPNHIVPVAKFQDVSNELEQGGFFVGDSP